MELNRTIEECGSFDHERIAYHMRGDAIMYAFSDAKADILALY